MKVVLVIFISLITSAQAQQKFSPAKESLRLFNKYKPTIERSNDARVDEPKIVCGDINGDSLADCLIAFAMTPKEGGNAIVGYEVAIYINTGKQMKVIGAFPHFGFCYSVDRIEGGIIYVKEHECGPPYMKIIRERRLLYKDGTIKAK